MAYTQADLDRIDAAIANGGAIKSMTFADQTYEFRDASDMLKLRAHIAQALSSGAKGRRLAATSKGV